MKIFVKARPKAKFEKVEKIDQSHYKVWVKAPAEKGKANAAIVKILADYFGTSKIKLVSGFSSRQKIFEIEK